MNIIALFPRQIQQLFILGVGFVVFMMALEFNDKILLKPNITISREKHSINFNSSLNYTHFGLKRLFTAVLWVKTLMDSDVDRNYDRNGNSWLYFRFLTIAELDPKFLENYQLGGQYLSIVKDDLIGAEYLYKLGLKQYPDNYFLNFNLAFVYFSELKDARKAIPYLIKIKDHELAPSFIKALTATLMIKEDYDKETIIQFLENAINTTDIPELKNNLLRKKNTLLNK